MPHRTTYEIVIRGQASPRLLRPLLDNFTFDHSAEGTTRLIGEVSDAAHLHGLYAHLASVNAEVISIAPLTDPSPDQHRSTKGTAARPGGILIPDHASVIVSSAGPSARGLRSGPIVEQ